MKHQPLKIEFFLKYKEVKISHNPFDSILARVYFDNLKANGEFNGDYAARLPFLKWNDNGFYHASNPFYKIKSIDNYTYFKSFDVKLYEQYGKNPSASTFRNTLSGRYKNWVETFELEFVDSIVYFINADKEEIIKLLKQMRYIGKKISIGFGKIEKFVITELDDDYSVTKNNKPMRYLPLIDEYKKLDNDFISKKRLVHPYWSKKDRCPCIIPQRREYDF